MEQSRYTLLQNSDGDIWRGNPLRINDFLEGLMKPGAINVWYYASYDWNMAMQQAPKRQRLELFIGRCNQHERPVTECKQDNCDGFHPGSRCQNDHSDPECTESWEKATDIDNFRVKIIPKKILIVSRDGEQAKHYDSYSFFARSFVKTLEMCKIPVPPIIPEGKAGRGDFQTWPQSKVEEYNLTECRLLVQVMDMLRGALETIGYADLKGWHGPGAIASLMMDKMEVTDKMILSKYDKAHLTIARAAYYGGRSELFKRGEYSPTYNYDINSAYPSATRELPTLAVKKDGGLVSVQWDKIKGEEILRRDFGVAKVKWKAKEPDFPMGPFPFRVGSNSFLPEDNIIFPTRMAGRIVYPGFGTGWYHLVEVKAAVARGFWDIEVLGGQAIENGYEKPYYEPITQMMKKRLEYKAAGNFAHLPIKLGANSFYGKFAERMEDVRAFGRYNNMLYAGFQTAWTRAQILLAVDPWNVIMISTDGHYDTEPLSLPIGEGLGEWEFDLYDSGQFILPGIYRVTQKGKPTVKARGYPVKKLEEQWDWVYSNAMRGRKTRLDDTAFIPVRKSLRAYKKFPVCGFYPAPKVVDRDVVNDKRAFLGDSVSLPYLPSPGRPEEAQSKLFDLFGRRKKTGLEDQISVEGDD